MCGDKIFLLEKVRSATILVYILNFADMYVEKIYKCLVKGVENDIDQIPKEDLKKSKYQVTYYNCDT